MCVSVSCEFNIHVLIFHQSDFDTPFVPPGGEVSQGKTSSEGSVSEDGIAIVMSLGFTREQAIKALKATVSGEIDGGTNGWMVGWRMDDEWMDGRMNEWTDRCGWIDRDVSCSSL